MRRRLTPAKLLTLGILGGSAPFSPLSIPGLQLWLDASDAATLFQASDGTTPAAADGDVVGYWADKSTNAYHATQGVTGNKPTLQVAEQNGRAVLRFDGDDRLALPAGAVGFFRNASYGYAFAVVKSTETVAANRSFFGVATAAGLSRFNMQTDTTTSNRPALSARRLDADSTVTIRSTANHANAYVLVVGVAQWAAGTLQVRHNGTQTATGNFAASGATSDADSNAPPTVGSFATSPYLLGDIAELIVYKTSAALTAEQISAVETYLNTKWAVY